MKTEIWKGTEIEQEIPSFLEVYLKRPIINNDGGMKAPHMFATWYLLKKLNPKFVIESGVWKGQGTWLIEQALPKAKIYAIDPSPHYREYTSANAEYFEADFEKIDWSIIPNKSETVLFFDDHQNALNRVKTANYLGFEHLIFEDNYPPSQGDCYSLKKAFAGSGFAPERKNVTGVRSFLAHLFTKGEVKPNAADSAYLRENLSVYYEFPPIYKSEKTRWGDDWKSEAYPTKDPIFQNDLPEDFEIFKREAKYYTWICYARLNRAAE